MTSIPPSSAVPPSGTAPAAPAAPAAGSTAVLTQLPEAVRATSPGSVITGTVVGRDAQGQTLLQTDSGVIGLRTAAQLAIGSQITLQIQAAGSQLQAILLAAVAPKPGAATAAAAARPAATPAAAAAPAPATTVAMSTGPVLTATVLSPTTGGPLPAQTAPAGGLGAGGPPIPAPTAPGTAPSGPAPAAALTATPANVRTASGAPLAPSAPSAPPVPGAPATGGAAAPATPLVAQSFQAAGPSISSAAASYAATRGATPPATPTPPGPGPAAPTAPTTTPQTAATPPSPASAAPPAPPGSAAPATPLQPAAAGTPVQLRLIGPTATTPLPASQVTGTLVGYAPGGQAVVDTPLGRLALPLPPGAAHPSPGTSLVFELLGLGARPAGSSPAGILPALGREWPTLKTAMTALADVDLPLARQILEINMPRLGSPRFLGQVLQYLGMAGAAEARTLLGDTAAAMLDRAGRGDVLARLDADLREMNRLNTSNSDWRVFWVPILDANELRQLRIFTRRRKAEKDKERDGGRFVVEMDFEDLGALQIDGLVQKPRIDVILRSHAELPPGMQAGIAEVFGRTCDASGLVGKIFFHATTTFPVSPLDEIARAGPGLSV